MEVGTEAKRIMVVALGKLYSSRAQRGGLRLHRSLLLSLVMKSARDIYHATYTEPHGPPVRCLGELYPLDNDSEPAMEELLSPAEAPCEPADKENACPSLTSPPRKRRGKKAAEPDVVPCKKAKLEQQLALTSALTDFVNYGELAPQTPLLVHRTVAVC